MAPILAIFAMLLLGAVAIATDLSVTTHYKRALQNVTDSAALAAAALLPTNPTTGSGGDQYTATKAALDVVHNSYQFFTPGPLWDQVWAGQACGASGCSITVCAGISPPSGACDKTVSPGSATPSWFTINTPPKSAKVTGYDGNVHYAEVFGSQRTQAFFGGVLGVPTIADAAESVAFHYAAGQPFPFGLYAKTFVLSGNQNETVRGNVYSDRYLEPQASGMSGICADSVGGVQSFIVLGAPQHGDSGYANDGQDSLSGHPNADPLVGGIACPETNGHIGMTATPSASNCKNAFNIPGSPIGFDSFDNACEANPSIAPPSVAPPPSLPAYPSSKQFGCSPQPGGSGRQGGSYQPGEYKCTTNTALTVNSPMTPGVYEIDAGGQTCDVSIDNTVTSLTGITFYLKGSVNICVAESGGMTISQSPYNFSPGCEDPGDCRYDIFSDGNGTPQIIISKTGAGGVYHLDGVIWMPNGNVVNVNKGVVEVNGQAIVNQWNDQSGDHTNPNVTYNGGFAPPQMEQLQLAE